MNLKAWFARAVIRHRLRELRREIKRRYAAGGLSAALASAKAWGIIWRTVAQGLHPYAKLDGDALTKASVEAGKAVGMNQGMGKTTIIGSILLGVGGLCIALAGAPIDGVAPWRGLLESLGGMLLSGGVTLTPIGLRRAIEKHRLTIRMSAEVVDQALAEIERTSQASESKRES